MLAEWGAIAALAAAAEAAAGSSEDDGDEERPAGQHHRPTSAHPQHSEPGGSRDVSSTAPAAPHAAAAAAAASTEPPQAAPDLLSSCSRVERGTSCMAWQPTPGFGARGRAAGGHLFWSARPPGSRLRAHYRRPLGAAGAAAELVVDEAAAAAASGGAGAYYELESIAVSPRGDLVAVTERRRLGGPLALRVLHIGGGGECCADVSPVAGPAVWASPAPAAWGSSGVPAAGVGSSSSTTQQAPPSVAPGQHPGAEGPQHHPREQQAQHHHHHYQQQHLLYITADEMEVRALSFPSSHGTGCAGSAPGSASSGADPGLSQPEQQPAAGALVYRDPFGVRAGLWQALVATADGGAASNMTFLCGFVPDGAPMDVWCLPPGADPLAGLVGEGSVATNTQQAAAAAEAGAQAAAGSGGGGWVRLLPLDATARLAVSAWGSWLFLR